MWYSGQQVSVLGSHSWVLSQHLEPQAVSLLQQVPWPPGDVAGIQTCAAAVERGARSPNRVPHNCLSPHHEKNL
jgi:hypothetical protein